MTLREESICHSERASSAEARNLASKLRPGDVVAFFGDLGSGKTFFCREIIKFFCGADTEVSSPTYNILQIYGSPNFQIYHFDLYRIKNLSELEGIGFFHALESSSSIILLEWPEIALKFLPKNSIRVFLKITKGFLSLSFGR